MTAEHMGSVAVQLSKYGYAVVPDVLDRAETSAAARSTEQVLTRVGSRRLLDERWCQDLADRLAGNPCIRGMLPLNAQAVQCTSFVKTGASNWLVSLHQDLSLPVAERVSSAHCKGWSEKEGETFVQPPIAVLDDTLAVRVHLDDCRADNGALRVIRGSHLLGRLSPSDIARVRKEAEEVVVSVPEGGAMLMRPLLLHASSKTTSENLRRVLHFVYGPGSLPEGLRWPARKRSCPSGS